MKPYASLATAGHDRLRKLETSVQFRDLLLVVGTAIYILLLQTGFVSFTPTFLIAAAALFSWNRVAAALYRRSRRPLGVAWISGVLDVAVCTLLVRETGGASSVLLPLYFIIVVGGVTHVDARFGAALLLLSGLSLSAMVLPEMFPFSPPATVEAPGDFAGDPTQDSRYRGLAVGSLLAFLIPILYSSALLTSKLRLREAALGRANTNLHTLYEVGRPLADTLSTEKVAETIVQGLSSSFGMERVELFLLTHGGTLDSVRRIPETVRSGPGDSSRAGDLRSRLDQEGPVQEGQRIFMTIGTKARVLGLLVADLPPPGRALDADELNTIRLLCGQAGIAIENARLYEKTERLSRTDGLTQLYNHRFFQERIHEEFKRSDRFGQTLSLLMIDVDDFKRINDTFGHQAGDDVLQRIARVVRSSLREVDVPARYGGDEFAIILPDTELREAIEVGERLRKSVEKHPFTADGTPVSLTLSLGTAARTAQSHVRPEELIKMADQALFDAKSRGRNAVNAYAPA